MKQRVNIPELNCLNIALKGRYNEQDDNTKVQVYYRPQGNVFTRVCHSVHSWGMRGRGRGHAWQGGMCVRRVHGRGVCMAGECAWQGACMAGRACMVGACMVGGGGVHGRGGGMHGR